MEHEQLTDEQKKAASHKKGPACVIAGAGTGKTRTLTERIFWLVKDHHLPLNRILVTTFTRKATAELYNQAYERLGENAQKLRISTIDALIWDLAQQASQHGFMPSTRLIGEAEQRLLLLQSAWETFGKESAYSRTWWTEAERANLVDLLESYIRAQMAKGREKKAILETVKSKIKKSQRPFNFPLRILTLGDLDHASKKYFERLQELRATDYNLSSRDFLRCLKGHKNLVEEFATEFDSILVDEFQDTSRIQAEILLLLSGKKRHIWVVGDPCQQIYEWRGAGPENLLWFVKKTRAKKYHLTENWRSTQLILDSAYRFLSRRVPSLKKNGMLRPLKSMRDRKLPANDQVVFLGKLDQALWFVKRLLESRPDLKPGNIAILSRELSERTVKKEIEPKARANGLEAQLHSSRADHVMDDTLGDPPDWRAGKALENLYNHPKIKNRISRSLREIDFTYLRTIRPIATAAEALDSTLPPHGFTFREAWPALKKTQDREISVTPAVVARPDAIKVMTIHAAKGLEFPVVLLMKLGKGFPNPKVPEDNRLAYVGATRARDLLILVRTGDTRDNLKKILSAFGNIDKDLIRIRRNQIQTRSSNIEAPTILHAPPLVAASDLDLYEQCHLKFAAYHEGRYLPKWSEAQSRGSRMHKALEYYLRAQMPNDQQVIDQYFQKGLEEGDSPLRKLRQKKKLDEMREAYQNITKNISETSRKILAIEQRYRYLQGNSGQIEGAIDALIERKDGAIVLKEWKTSSEIPSEKERQYELQARAGALGMVAHNSFPVDLVEIVPVLSPQNSISLPTSLAFFDESKDVLEQVFRDLRDRNYDPRRGGHCKYCQLKPHCPAWP